MKNEKENKLTEEWVTPSFIVMDMNKETKDDFGSTNEDGPFFS